MGTVIGVKDGTSGADFSLAMIQNLLYLKQEYSLCYYIIATDPTETWNSIATSVGLPAIGTPLYGAICDKLTPKEQKTVISPYSGLTTILWEVEVHFGTNTRALTDNNPEVNWGGELEDEVQEYDLITHQQITTTADEPIFIARQAFYQTLEVTRLESYPFDPNVPLLYCGTLNLTPFYGRPKGTGMMLPIQVQEKTINNQREVKVTYPIKFKIAWNYDGTLMSDTWQAHPLNQGYMVRPAIGAKPIKNVDTRGNPIKCNLDGNGVKLKDATGTQMGVVGPVTGLLFPAYQITDNLSITLAQQSDIGSMMLLTPNVVTTPYTEYLVIGTIGNNWVIQTPGLLAAGPYVWQLQRSPIYLNFNRGYYREFNALSLGPF